MVTPAWCSSRMMSKIPRTISGASPSEGSSSRSSRGRLISARAIASICCSPPESVPASCRRRSAGRGRSGSTGPRAPATAPTGRRTSYFVAQIGFDHRGVTLDVRGRAQRDELAEVQHRDAIAKVHDERHVVLDQEDGEAEARANATNEPAQAPLLPAIHAGGGLVEQKQLGLQRQGARDLEPALVAVGEVAGPLVGTVGEADQLEQRQGPATRLALLGARRGQPDHAAHEAARRPHVTRDHHVLERRELAEQTHVLKRARDAEAGDAEGPQARDVTALIPEPAGGGRAEARDEIEQRRLAGAVGPDQAEELAALHGERHAAHRHDTAEAAGERLHRQHVGCPRRPVVRRRAHTLPVRRPRPRRPRSPGVISPCGKKTVPSAISTPKMMSRPSRRNWANQGGSPATSATPRSASGSAGSTRPPTTGPTNVREPPTSTKAMRFTPVSKVPCGEFQVLMKCALMAPTAPASTALAVKARTL